MRRGFVDDRDAVALNFSRGDFTKAVSILLAEARDHGFLFPGGYTIIMNGNDRVLLEGKVPFDTQKVARPEDVSDEEMAELRHEHFFGRK